MNSREWLDDPLFQFELKIARRADELSRGDNLMRRTPLEIWCEAEREIQEQSPAYARPALTPSSVHASQ
jgi:hypothetical protein